MRLLLVGLLANLCLLPSRGAPETALTIVNGIGKETHFDGAQLRALPRTEVTVRERGQDRTFAGTALFEIFRKVGIPHSDALRGETIATYFVAEGADGYRALFSLTDADPAFSDADLLIADSVDGKPLPKDVGPLRLVAPRDKRMARSTSLLS